ncbi:MAG: lipopolysaccharide transport periplasmic protein LptA [Pseudomonadota bacterium]|jgi:lipopolysaccharide export system protein LptA
MKNLHWIIPILLLIGSQASLAERADRNKPINVESNSLAVDDEQHVQLLDGDVLLTQGTLTIRANKMVITEDAQGFQRGVATGGPKGKAYFRQKREGRQDYIEGEAERIEYNTRTEVAELFTQAWVKSGQDLIKGGYIWYDSMTEKYRANANPPEDRPATPTMPARVRAVLQPRSQQPANPSEEGGPVLLRGSTQIQKP